MPATAAFVLCSTIGVGGFPNCVAAADFNADGRIDLACVNDSGNSVTILTNRANQSFLPSTNLPVGNSRNFCSPPI